MTQLHALQFDLPTYQVWLDAPSTDGETPNRDVEPFSVGYQRNSGDAGWLVEATLDALRNTTLAPLAYGPGVSNVRVWTIAGLDGGLTGEVTVDGVALSLDRLTEAELVDTAFDTLPGYEAAAQAMTVVAEQVGRVAARFRQVGRPEGYAQLTERDITTALDTLAEVQAGIAPDDLSERQNEVIELVTDIWRARLGEDAETVDGELVEADEV